MDHRAFVSRLPDSLMLHLTARSDRAGLCHLAGHLGLILLGGVWIGAGWPLWQAVLPLQGIALVFLFTLEHEATHKTPFATEALNEWVGRLAGLVILLPFEWFRYFHLAHHRHTNIPGKDPELAGGGAPRTWPAYLLYASGLRYWVEGVRQLVVNAAGGDTGAFVPERARARIRREARWMLSGYGLALGTLAVSPLLFWVWLLPMILGQPFLRLYLLAEHGRCALVANMFENTRTTLTNRAIRFLAWNMPFHTEHHTLPMVPFHHLPRLHTEMRPYLQETAPGYAAFTRAYASHLGSVR
ncbi:MAG: fatty acid desaturase [Pseudomonadota bacterium]